MQYGDMRGTSAYLIFSLPVMASIPAMFVLFIFCIHTQKLFGQSKTMQHIVWNMGFIKKIKEIQKMTANVNKINAEFSMYRKSEVTTSIKKPM